MENCETSRSTPGDQAIHVAVHALEAFVGADRDLREVV
jgi:hypothetical protein